MKKILQELFKHKSLSKNHAKSILIKIANGEYNEYQISAFLTVFMMRSVSVNELSGFREALLELCIPIDLSDYKAIDLCGTGGDGHNTFNISTLASFIVAGAGEMVAKHGNYGVSSFCGSSNVLEYLNCSFKTNQDDLKRDLDKAGICFIHAPLFNPGMKNIAPIRKNLGLRTFFNMLGPLVNPCRPQYQLVGVYSLELARLYKYVLQQGDSKYTILHSLDAYDEVSLTAPVKLISNNREELILPEQFNMNKLKPEQLYGGANISEAADIFYKILKCEGTQAQNNVAIVNAGLAINCLNPSESRADSISRAQESLLSGKALEVLKKLSC